MGLTDYIKNELPKWSNWINSILLKMNFFGSFVYGRVDELPHKVVRLIYSKLSHVQL